VGAAVAMRVVDLLQHRKRSWLGLLEKGCKRNAKATCSTIRAFRLGLPKSRLLASLTTLRGGFSAACIYLFIRKIEVRSLPRQPVSRTAERFLD
jgi:hypothetical protein